MKKILTSHKEERKVHKWDEKIQGKVVRRLSGVYPLVKPEMWLDKTPIPLKNVSDLRVEWKPYKPYFEWDKKKSHGKIHVTFRISNRVHIVVDDEWPIGITHCVIDGTDLLGLGNCFIRDADGQVFLNMKLWDRNKRRRDRFARELVVSAFSIGWENV